MPQKDDEIVITPGGPRSVSLVHTVTPGDIVEQVSQNTFTTHPNASAIRELHQELLATGDYEITPGGIRHKSMIHTVEAGEVVTAHKGVYKRFNVERQQFIDNHATPTELGPDLPGLGSGWITFAAYTEPAANVITEIITTWTVPPAPSRDDGQLVYLFNGLQDFPVTHILQPVLQWGKSPDGGGSSWAVASWFVGAPTDPVFKSPLTPVQPGDTLTGLVKMLTNHNGNFFFCISEFIGISASGLSINSLTQLVMPVEVLECYRMVDCRDYPDTVMTSMRAIDVRIASGSRPLSFLGSNTVTDCGQHTIVTSNTTGAGQVDLYYRTQFAAPAGTVITSVSRTANNIDLFAVASDGSVNTTFWTPAGGWTSRWFRLADPNFGDAFTVPPQTEISVLSRFAQHLDLFTVGRNACVYSTFWDGASGWSGHWFRLADSNFGDGFTVPLHTRVSQLARTQNNIDLFVSGFDGAVYSTFWSATGGWSNRWFRLADPNFGDHFTIPPGASVTSVARTSNNIDLFVTGRDGAVYSTFWNSQNGWSGHWFRLADPNFGDHFTLPPGSSVSAISRGADLLDLFATGRDGAVYSTFWNAQQGWSGHWFRLADVNFGDHFTLPPGSPVTAITRAPQQIDLFVSGKDGGVYTTAWSSSGGWLNHWIRLADNRFWDGFTIPPGVRVDAQARQSDIIDLFVVGKDNGVYSTFWNAQQGWAGRWFQV
jgi:hypothetical protein